MVDKCGILVACIICLAGFALIIYGATTQSLGFTIGGGFAMLVMFAVMAVAYYHERFPNYPTY